MICRRRVVRCFLPRSRRRLVNKLGARRGLESGPGLWVRVCLRGCRWWQAETSDGERVRKGYRTVVVCSMLKTCRRVVDRMTKCGVRWVSESRVQRCAVLCCAGGVQCWLFIWRGTAGRCCDWQCVLETSRYNKQQQKMRYHQRGEGGTRKEERGKGPKNARRPRRETAGRGECY